MTYVTATAGGQFDIKENYYQALPNSVTAGEVQVAAVKAAEQIN